MIFQPVPYFIGACKNEEIVMRGCPSALIMQNDLSGPHLHHNGLFVPLSQRHFHAILETFHQGIGTPGFYHCHIAFSHDQDRRRDGIVPFHNQSRFQGSVLDEILETAYAWHLRQLDPT